MYSQFSKAASLSRDRVLQKKKLPDSPGVYFLLGRNRKILYIGRATSLRDRVRSYFRGDILESRSPWIATMLHFVKATDFRKTDSVLEAILLEAELIKKFQPPYNTDEKDDKSFNCVVITKEPFPAVFVVRQTDIDSFSLNVKGQMLKVRGQKLLAAYGPFPNGFQLQTAMKIIRKILPYRDLKCKLPSPSIPHFLKEAAGRPEDLKSFPLRVLPLEKGEFPSLGKPCFNRQIGLCPGVCTSEISKKDYEKIIRNLRLFFEGKKSRLMKLLKNEMRLAAKAQKFEKAGELKRQLFALTHIQDVALLKNADFRRYADADKLGYKSSYASINENIRVHPHFRVEAYDLSHFGGKEIVGAMTVVEDGVAKRNEYRLFKLRTTATQNEAAGLREILRRRFNHLEWRSPDLIVVDGNEIQKKAAEVILREINRNILVVSVVKNEQHRPREILGDASSAARYSYIPRNVGISIRLRELNAAILLANSEAHRFALGFGRKRLRRAAGLAVERI